MNSTEQPTIQEKRESKEFSTRFLDETLEKSYSFAQHLDTQTNILVGVSMAVFLFSLSSFFDQPGQLPFLMLGLFAGLSCLIGLFAIHPPKFMRKRGQEESLMYHKHIIGFSTPGAYSERLKEIIEDKNAVVEQYATEIYNVSKYYYRPKRKLFHLARNLLMVGIVAALLTFSATLVLKFLNLELGL